MMDIAKETAAAANVKPSLLHHNQRGMGQWLLYGHCSTYYKIGGE